MEDIKYLTRHQKKKLNIPNSLLCTGLVFDEEDNIITIKNKKQLKKSKNNLLKINQSKQSIKIKFKTIKTNKSIKFFKFYSIYK